MPKMSAKARKRAADTDSTMLRPEELAKRWSISMNHLMRLAEKGEVPKPVRLGRSVRFPISEVLAYERGGK